MIQRKWIFFWGFFSCVWFFASFVLVVIATTLLSCWLSHIFKHDNIFQLYFRTHFQYSLQLNFSLCKIIYIKKNVKILKTAVSTTAESSFLWPNSSNFQVFSGQKLFLLLPWIWCSCILFFILFLFLFLFACFFVVWLLPSSSLYCLVVVSFMVF